MEEIPLNNNWCNIHVGKNDSQLMYYVQGQMSCVRDFSAIAGERVCALFIFMKALHSNPFQVFSFEAFSRWITVYEFVPYI